MPHAAGGRGHPRHQAAARPAGLRAGRRDPAATHPGTAPGTVASASLLSHLIATAQLANAPEFDPGTIPAADLERWQRPATPAQAPVMDREGPSDARWLWVLVLALLAVEFVARRWIDRARAEDAVEAAHARVA